MHRSLNITTNRDTPNIVCNQTWSINSEDQISPKGNINQGLSCVADSGQKNWRKPSSLLMALFTVIVTVLCNSIIGSLCQHGFPGSVQPERMLLGMGSDMASHTWGPLFYQEAHRPAQTGHLCMYSRSSRTECIGLTVFQWLVPGNSLYTHIRQSVTITSAKRQKYINLMIG